MNVRTKTINANGAATTMPAAHGDPDSDVRTLVQLVAAGGCRTENMRLVRWRNLRQFLDQRWAKVGPSVAQTMRKEIAARLGSQGRCVRYDDTSILAFCPPPDESALRRLDDEFADTMGSMLAGVLSTPGLIEVLKPVAAGDQGLAFAAATVSPAGEARPPAADIGKPAPALVLGDAIFRYFPLWDIRDDAVYCYLCEAFWNLGDGQELTEGALPAQFDDPKRILALDLGTLGKATEELDKGLNQYQLAKFLIPVHFRTIADPVTAGTYTRFCNSKMWAVHEFALFEIVKPLDDMTTEQLVKAVEQLQPFGAGVMLRVGIGFDRFDAVPPERILSIGIDLRLDDRPDVEIVAAIKQFAAGAGEHGLRSHVHGVHRVSPTVIAACAGIDLIGSDAIAQDTADWQSDDSAIRPIALLKSLAARGKANRGVG
ncbi:MAG TPA: hypothetical protein VF987_04650 [Rhodospirillales bacterium]